MKVKIREYSEQDAEAHCNAVRKSLECLSKWFTWVSSNYCLCDSNKFIKEQLNPNNKERFNYAIVSVDDGEFLGSCSLRKVKTYDGKQVAAMSYWCKQDKQGNGITTQAVEQLIKKAFYHLGIDRIEIDVAHCNKPSEYIAKKYGKPEVDMTVYGGDNKKHDGTRYIVEKPKYS